METDDGQKTEYQRYLDFIEHCQHALNHLRNVLWRVKPVDSRCSELVFRE